MEKKEVFGEAFVTRMFALKDRPGARAALKGAGSEQRATYAWEYISPFVNLTNETGRSICLLIATCIALDEASANGPIPFAKALSGQYAGKRAAKQEQNADTGRDVHDPSQIRMRRLLSCRTATEACDVLRPIIRLIQSKGVIGLDYISLYGQLCRFDRDPESVKARWAQDFFGGFDDNRESGDKA